MGSKVRLCALACVLATMSVGVQAQEKESIWSKVKKSAGGLVSVNGQPIGQDAEGTAGNYTRVADTPLHGIYMSDAAINGDWPHVAIVITDYSDRLLGRGINPTSNAQSTDCIYFDAHLWHNATRSETFSGLGHCASDGMKGFMQTGMTVNFSTGNTSMSNTGQVRNTGPRPPLKIFPQTPDAQRLLDGPGRQIMATILDTMGYDIMHVPNIGRVWVVSVENKPGT